MLEGVSVTVPAFLLSPDSPICSRWSSLSSPVLYRGVLLPTVGLWYGDPLVISLLATLLPPTTGSPLVSPVTQTAQPPATF